MLEFWNIACFARCRLPRRKVKGMAIGNTGGAAERSVIGAGTALAERPFANLYQIALAMVKTWLTAGK